MTLVSGPQSRKRCRRCGCSKLRAAVVTSCRCCQGELNAGLSQPRSSRSPSRKGRKASTSVEAKPTEPFDQMVRRFTRAVRSAGVLTEARARRWYRSPAERRRGATLRARTRLVSQSS